ncbi:MAG TPA: ParB N-terminal domain-containing protein [Longimicrobiaceae bacterium]|nr:ParB N-terminal domain-containing protein [Longimicrobiaceae bacterium]
MELSNDTLDMFDDGDHPQERTEAVPELSDEPARRPGGGEYAMVPTGSLLPCPWPIRLAADPTADAELDGSIRSQGILHPLLVRRTGAGLEILAGMRRWDAARRLGLAEVPVRIITVTEDQARVVTVLENSARLGLSVWDESRKLIPLLEHRWELQESVLVREIRALTSWSMGKASSRRRMLFNLTPEVWEKGQVSESQLASLGLRILEKAARQETLDLRAAVLFKAVHGHHAPWLGSDLLRGKGKVGYTFRVQDGGERLTLSVRPGSVSPVDKPGIRRSLLLVLEALGDEFRDIREQLSSGETTSS